jgi:hypothetical protein
MVATAAAGMLTAAFLIFGQYASQGSTWRVCAGISVLLASVGLMTAGLIPLPNQLHYAFGLTMAGILTPGFGALFLMSSGERRAAGILLSAMALIVGLVALRAPPVAPGIAILTSIAYLCWIARPLAVL